MVIEVLRKLGYAAIYLIRFSKLIFSLEKL